MLKVLLLSALLVTLVTPVFSRTCDCSQYNVDQEENAQDTINWLNGLLASWYDISSDQIFQLINDLIEKEVSDKLPFPIRSVALTQLNVEKPPQIKLITSTVNRVVCDDARFVRYILDLDLTLDTPNALAVAKVTFPLYVSATVSIEDVKVKGVLRMEILMSSEQAFPGMQNMKLTFIDRPKVDFDVELYDLIGLDTFGIAGLIEGKVADALQKLMVYPGMLFLDLSPLSRKEDMVTLMIDNDPALSPGILSARVTLTPLNITVPRSSVEGWFDYGEGKSKKVVLGNGNTHQFDVFLTSFEHPHVNVKILERNVISRDRVWVEVDGDVTEQLKSGNMRKRVSKIHREGGNSWNATIDFYAYLLPPVHIMPDNTLLPSLYSQTKCRECGENGVLNIVVHGAANLTIEGGDIDPYVSVRLDGVEIMKTGTKFDKVNPVYEERTEILLRANGKKLSERELEFKVYDYDSWSSDDYIGAVTMPLEKDLVLHVPRVLYVGGEENGQPHGLLFISVIFRPVPFM